MNMTETPTHIGVILDGNRRWARAQGLAIQEGHRLGLKKVHEFLTWCDNAGVSMVTLWLLSTDNLRKRNHELEPLFTQLAETIRDLDTAERWKVRHIGSDHALSAELITALADTVHATRGNPGMEINLAIGYGGRDEIIHAAREFASRCTQDGVDPAALSDDEIEKRLTSHLYTAGQPEPDLIIRTSGELRLSGFMPWQTAQSELYFTPVPWPALARSDLAKALAAFATRQRRRGA